MLLTNLTYIGDVLIVITGREKVVSLQVDGGKHDIYRVTSTKILPFSRAKLHLSNKLAADEEHFLAGIQQVLDNDNFYFCYTWDLTRCKQRQITQPFPLWTRADNRFYFNRYLQRRMIDLTMGNADQNLGAFILPVISGFVGFKEVLVSQKSFSYGLISRRGVLRAGTRYFSRGIDSDGNVSNFVETEQLVIYQDRIYSHVQLRGSIPLFWKQLINTKYKPEIIVHSTPGTIDAAKRHFDDLRANYGRVICFNLVDSHGYEESVGNSMTSLIASFQDIIYKHFDFHKECRKMQWERISILANEFEREISDQGYFASDMSGTTKMQTSVIRTNCMDCLDRTNVVQSELARLVLVRQLRAADIFSSRMLLNEAKELEFVFKNIWADNADAISMMYSGTGALKTDFTRTGKRTKLGALQDGVNSAIRYLKNNYADGRRQDAYDLLTGKYELSAARSIASLDKTWRFYTIPAVLFAALGMLMFTVLISIPSGDNVAFRILFWMTVVSICLRVILYYGEEFVDVPRLINPYTDTLMVKYTSDIRERSKKPAQL